MLRVGSIVEFFYGKGGVAGGDPRCKMIYIEKKKLKGNCLALTNRRFTFVSGNFWGKNKSNGPPADSTEACI